MSKKTNKFNISINSIGTTDLNVEGSEELVRDVAEMLINPIQNHKVQELENRLYKNSVAFMSENDLLEKRIGSLEREKELQDAQLKQLAKTIELENEHYIKLTDRGISVKDEKAEKDVKVSDEYRVTSGLNNGIENRTDRIEKTVSGFNKAISNIQTALYKTGKNKLDKQKQQEDHKPKRKRAYKLKGSDKDYVYKESDGFNIGQLLDLTDYAIKNGKVNTSHSDNKYTGIKTIENGEKKFQCRYVCPKCEHKGKRFVFEHNNVAYCHKCNEKMQLHSVKSLTGQEKDIFNNYYAAGLYQPIMNDKRKEDE